MLKPFLSDNLSSQVHQSRINIHSVNHFGPQFCRMVNRLGKKKGAPLFSEIIQVFSFHATD